MKIGFLGLGLGLAVDLGRDAGVPAELPLPSFPAV
jgi:hypothetical protein